ncbi:MAG: YwiC-like family protein [Thermodesulfovibrionales bacterium]
MAHNGNRPVYRYFLKEYGSWGVMTMSYVAGLVAARQVTIHALAGFLSLALLINAKQALSVWMRTPPGKRYAPGMFFILQVLVASALLIPLFQQYGLVALLPFALFPVVYLLSLKILGEHALCTEVLGFILLSLSSLVAKAAVGGGLDARLFFVVAVFFSAGVFRVRIQLKKEFSYRAIMIAYVALAIFLFLSIGCNPLLLLPLADNLIFAVVRYRVGLPTTGWIEMTKGFVFLLLLAVFGY